MSQTEIDELRAQLASLTERLARLESVSAPEAPDEAAPAPRLEAEHAGPILERIPEDVLIAVSAAVAAFLGERAHIRKIRVVSSPAWAQQGRVWIQASHLLQR